MSWIRRKLAERSISFLKAFPYGKSRQTTCPEVEYTSFTKLANILLILTVLGLFVLALMGLGELLGIGLTTTILGIARAAFSENIWVVLC